MKIENDNTPAIPVGHYSKRGRTTMVFQAFTTGYLITTSETVLVTGKRTAPLWLTLLTITAAVSALIGGVLIIMLLNTSRGGGPQDFSDTAIGVIALLLTVFFPATMSIKAYLRLDNPMTIPRSSIMTVEKTGAAIKFLATVKGGSKPVWFSFNTRCQEEAENIEFNLAVHAHGRLRCYPVTFLPRHQQTIIYAGQKEVKGPVQL